MSLFFVFIVSKKRKGRNEKTKNQLLLWRKVTRLFARYLPYTNTLATIKLKVNIDSIIDKKTVKFLQELRIKNDIEFEKKNIDYCEVKTKNGKSVIYCNPEICDTESIMHELLHIWLNQFDYVIGNHLYLSSQSNSKLSKVFTKFLCDYIENCLDHFKMYPKYKEFGYSDGKFIRNGLKEKCSIQDIKGLNLKFLFVYKAYSINKFIGFLISIYADHINNDYTKHLNLLRKKDSKLFQIVSDFWKKWVDFDIENIGPIYNSDTELADNFLREMEIWIKDKMII